MTDLELTKLAAEAMGLVEHARTPEAHGFYTTGDSFACWRYDPLRNDAQAMALVKQFRLDAIWDVDDEDGTTVRIVQRWQDGEPSSDWGRDLNRAIVEAVARMLLAAKVTT